MKSTLKLQKTAVEIIKKRYLQKDDQGKIIETPEQMFERVASNIASAEEIYNQPERYNETAQAFYELMTSLEFLPNSPTLMNAGRKLQQLSACFVLPVNDSLESIFETIKNTALIHKSGGGTGFNFSFLRPQNDVVQTTKGISSGPVSFMNVFDAATEAIKQGGTRRGANMAILNVNHPDIIKFISAKKDPSKLTNFNLSVGVNDSFIKAVKEDSQIDLINPRTSQLEKIIRAQEIFDLVVENAWKNGEPGIIFLDRIEEDNPTPKIGKIESTNPCGEQPLLNFEACTLGSLNLSLMVSKNGQPKIDWERLRERVHLGVHFLDNAVDVTRFPLKQIEDISLSNRKIGLGVMGFADLLIKLGIPYDSKQAIEVAEKTMSFIQKEAFLKSEQLAEERGAFPNFENSIYFAEKRKKLRNATLTTIAPAGTISIIAGTTGGIEPVFSYYKRRRALNNQIFTIIHPLLMDMLKEHSLSQPDILKELEKKGSPRQIKKIPDEIKNIFPAAFDIKTDWHIKIQAAFQKYTDNAVSKTINLPTNSTKEDVANAFLMAFSLKCKGITVYRHRSRSQQVLDLV